MTQRTEDPSRSPRRRGGLRLTRRVFWDLAVYMIGLGVAVGLVFPPFTVLLGVPATHAARPSFAAACLAAGFLVGAANYALCRGLVGGRLEVLSTRLRSVAGSIAAASRTGDWSGATPDRIAVDSDDQLGATASALNNLLDALEEGAHFRSLVRNASDVITVVDRAGTISYQTPSVGWVLGYPPTALLGADVHSLVHNEDAPAFRAYLDAAVGGTPQPSALVCRVRHRTGSWRWAETVANDLLDDPAVSGIVLTTRDVSDRRELEERLRLQAFHDPLTGLPNRTLFMERLRAAEDLHATSGTDLAVLFLDVDNLKTVNDSLGHEAGDLLLHAVTARVATCLRGQDTLARLSGDEFAVLLTGTDSSDHAQRVAERVLTALHEPVHLTDRYITTGVSIGIATTAACAASGIALLRAADLAMYVAKSAGKGRCETFQATHHARQLDRERLRADLHQALDEHQLVLHYQPIIELATGRLHGFEALLRWQHPQRGLIPPSEFIPLAEETGLVVPLGRWVLREATRQAAAWQRDRGHPGDGSGPGIGWSGGLRMNVNVSARQFHHPALVHDVADALHRARLDPRLLTLELTETLLLQDTTGTTRRLRELKNLGVRLALDDFGTGYSSLSYLRRFPIDTLKVDRSFIQSITSSPQDLAVAGAILRLGAILHLEVIAEGLETPEQIGVLTQLGCPLGQGYHLAGPLPAQQATRLACRAVEPASGRTGSGDVQCGTGTGDAWAPGQPVVSDRVAASKG